MKTAIPQSKSLAKFIILVVLYASLLTLFVVKAEDRSKIEPTTKLDRIESPNDHEF